MNKTEQINKFAQLYQGLERARGIWHSNGRMETERDKPGIGHFKSHLEGKIGIGIVPINDESQCWWGAIDIDAHDEGDFIDMNEMDKNIQSHGLPLIACQSKSLGAHLYTFFSEPIEASLVQSILKNWAVQLGHPGVEVFPKQTKLHKNQLGNWINLPYYNASDTIRFAVHKGKNLKLTEFLKEAYELRMTKAQFKEVSGGDDHGEAPPCVQSLLTGGIEAGSRNNAMFAVGTYLKIRGTHDLEEELTEINYDKTIMPKALSKKELNQIIGSLNRQDYNYRCNETPICNICDVDLCRKRQYGVEAGKTKLFDVALWGSLTKVLSDPPRWIMEVSGIPIELTTEQLMEYRALRKAVLEKVDIVIPPMKAEDWLIILREKVENRIEVEAPEDAGPGAMIAAMMDEFCKIAEKFHPDGKPIEGKKDELLSGLPIMMQDPKDN